MRRRCSGARFPYRRRSGALLRILEIALSIAKLCLRGTDVLVDIAFHLLIRIPDYFTGNFLNFARHFFGSAFNLIFVDAHELTPGKTPAIGRHDESTIVPGAHNWVVGSIADSLSEDCLSCGSTLRWIWPRARHSTGFATIK